MTWSSPTQPTVESAFAKRKHLSTTFAKMQASTLQSGEICPEDCAPDKEELTRPQSQKLHTMRGTWVAAQEVDASLFAGVVWPRLTPLERALSRAQAARCHPSLGSMPRFSWFFSCGASGAHFPCKLLVWPSTRFAWPSPLSLGSGLGSQRILIGEAARVCREAGARVSLNVRVHDLDLPPLGRPDNRRIEIIADGLPLFHGAQLAVDTTMVSALRADGNPHRQSDAVGGATLTQARWRKELTYPKLTRSMVARALSCWRVKSADVGLMKLASSSQVSRGPKPGLSRGPSGRQRDELGTGDGAR